mgnify:CR=1 FL=1
MILELVAGRIVAPYVGVSLYTWTGIIGVVLAGISLGNYLGGVLADRRASLRLLGVMFGLAGVTSLGILTVDVLGPQATGGLPIVPQILVLTAALFLLPCLILGTISPIVAKLAVQDLERTGRTVGRIYAAGSMGSIVGTFATGFLLISWFGTHVIVAGVALLLLALGLLFLLPRRLPWALAAVLVLSGRTHLYEGHGPTAVVHAVRSAVLSGCRVVCLTNASGSLRSDVGVGTPVVISDHLNLTGTSPLLGAEPPGAVGNRVLRSATGRLHPGRPDQFGRGHGLEGDADQLLRPAAGRQHFQQRGWSRDLCGPQRGGRNHAPRRRRRL